MRYYNFEPPLGGSSSSSKHRAAADGARLLLSPPMRMYTRRLALSRTYVMEVGSGKEVAKGHVAKSMAYSLNTKYNFEN